MKYKLEVTISGGVTGTRTSDVKERGELIIFNKLEDAAKAAEKYQAAANSRPYQNAYFIYSVQPIRS